MPSRLQDLRKRAGYATAREFADAAGIPQPTYARYESSPEKIPLKAAWNLADRLGSTIDKVVGRDEEPVPELKGQVQIAWEALSKRSQADALDYLAFLAERDAADDKSRRYRRLRRWEGVAARTERLFQAGVQARDGGDVWLAAADGDEYRAAFREFAQARVREVYASGELPSSTDEADALAQLMAGYDRAHGIIGPDDDPHVRGGK